MLIYINEKDYLNQKYLCYLSKENKIMIMIPINFIFGGRFILKSSLSCSSMLVALYF